MNGIIVLNKPKGKTSHDEVYFMRRLTGIKKIGHTGTLDPDATGVLPLCIGSATKAADMLTESDKSYRAVMVLGKTTDTEDASGTVLTECEVKCTDSDIRNAVGEFVGEIEQIPPMYSAIKQNGKKLYELARQGIEVERKKRRVRIHSIDILDIDMEKNSVVLDVSCSKGTYIRTLCADIGKRLGTGAYMSELMRTKAGPFTLDNSYTEEELVNIADNGGLGDVIIPVDAVFCEYPKIYLNEKQTKSIVNGIRMTYRDGVENQSYRLYDRNGKFLCISKCADGKLVLEKSFWT